MKRSLTSLIIKEMQIKTTMRYHLTLVKMAIIKESINDKRWRGSGEKWILAPCWWERKLVQSLWRTVWTFLRKLTTELPYDPAVPFLGMYSEKMKILIVKDTCTPVFKEALFTIARTCKQPKCPPTEEWTKIMWYIYTKECYSAIKKDGIIPLTATWMDLENNHTKWSKSEDKHHILLICGI